MPNLGTPSPASTPMLMLENNYRQMQDWGRRRDQELRSLGLDDEMLGEKLQELQAEVDKRRADIETNMNTVRQTQNWIDLGIIDSATGDKLKWGAVVPEEALDMMFPEPEGFYRRPFTQKQLKEDFQPRMKAFFKAAKIDVPWGRDKPPTHETLFQQYRTWQTSIGYHGALSNAEQGQVDREWDAWARNNYPESSWNPTAREVRALRAKGPITRGFGARFRGTPIGPTEPINPLQENVRANLPKPKRTFLERVGEIGTPGMRPAQPQPEDKPARINIRNKKTGKRMFSDDGGRTWQNSK